MPLHPVGCQPTALQVRPPMPRAASYLQHCPTTPPHPVGCQPTALQVRPPMPRTDSFVQLCLFTL